jgi:hypothetical protein
MSVQPLHAEALSANAPTCCAFCRKALPVVNGQLQPWRAPNGLFFCNEFCADDAEEASFQKRRGSRETTLNARA